MRWSQRYIAIVAPSIPPLLQQPKRLSRNCLPRPRAGQMAGLAVANCQVGGGGWSKILSGLLF